MQTFKTIALNLFRTLMAFVCFMNGLAAASNGLTGKFSLQEFWAPLFVALIGSCILCFSFITIQQCFTERNHQWKQNISNNLWQVIFVWLLAYFGFVSLCVAVTWAFVTYSDVNIYRALVIRGINTKGWVTATEPNNHQVVHYSYRVKGKVYTGISSANDQDFDKLKAGALIPVSFDPANPKKSIIGNPSARLENELVFLILVLVMIPIGIFGKLRAVLPTYTQQTS